MGFTRGFFSPNFKLGLFFLLGLDKKFYPRYYEYIFIKYKKPTKGRVKY